MAKILVVDDNAYTRQMLTAILVPEGHEVIGETDAHQLIEIYEANQPDLVMLDIVMPDIDGITAAKDLLAAHPEARIIIESAQQANTLQKEAEEIGIVGFVPKPFDVETITAVIKEVLK